MVKAKLLTLSKVMPQRNRYDSVKARKKRQEHGKDWELLTRCKNAWNNLSGVRETRARTMRYCTETNGATPSGYIIMATGRK